MDGYHNGAAARHSNPEPFRLGRVSIGLGNKDYWGRQALGEATVTAGPVEFTGYIHANGEVVLPSYLRDDGMRREIAHQLRGKALQEIACRWIARDEREQGEARP